MRPRKSHSARNEEVCLWKAYLISTEMHNALLLTQLSALIRSTVEHDLKHTHYATYAREYLITCFHMAVCAWNKGFCGGIITRLFRADGAPCLRLQSN